MREAFDDVLRFWYARGIAGFRIDVCHAIVKDRELRDDPAATPDDHPLVRERGTRQVFSINRPEVHEVLTRWRRVSDPDRILVGETYVLELDQLIPYYGTGEDQLHLAFNFLFVHSDLETRQLRGIVEAMEERLPAGACPVWTGSNHDAGRLATRWAGGDEAKVHIWEVKSGKPVTALRGHGGGISGIAFAPGMVWRPSSPAVRVVMRIARSRNSDSRYSSHRCGGSRMCESESTTNSEMPARRSTSLPLLVRAHTMTKKSVFLLCRLSSADPRFPRYPRLPVLTCAGYNQAIGLRGEEKT